MSSTRCHKHHERWSAAAAQNVHMVQVTWGKRVDDNGYSGHRNSRGTAVNGDDCHGVDADVRVMAPPFCIEPTATTLDCESALLIWLG